MPSIHVESHIVTFAGSSLGADHLYLVYRADDGQEVVIGGRPESASDVFGGAFLIETNVAIEQSLDARDDETPEDRNASELHFPDISVDAAWSLMLAYARMIDAADQPYSFLTTNSNALVGALTESAGVSSDGFPPEPDGPLGPVGLDHADQILTAVPPPVTGDLLGSAGDDVYSLNAAGNAGGELHGETYRTFAGNDRIMAGGGDDMVSAGDGDDIAAGGSGNDTLFGRSGADRLDGNRGDDILRGGRQDDWLHGGKGSDVVIGGPGADRIMGGTGADVLTGDGGADVFVFASSRFGADVITDFETGVDQVEIHSDTTFDAFIFATRQVGDDLLWDPGADGRCSILLQGVTADDLTEADILFL